MWKKKVRQKPEENDTLSTKVIHLDLKFKSRLRYVQISISSSSIDKIEKVKGSKKTPADQ